MTWSCIAVKKPLVSAEKPHLSAISSTILCLHIVGWGHTDGGHARLFGTFVSWLCYYILNLWGVHLHLRGLSPVVCTYHLLLLLQHEETTWPVCLRSMSEGASPVYRVVELYQSIIIIIIIIIIRLNYSPIWTFVYLTDLSQVSTFLFNFKFCIVSVRKPH